MLLYAQWQKASTSNPVPDVYTVIYNANGGTGSYTDKNLKYEDNYTVLGPADTGISRDGYTFTGWNTQPNGRNTSYKSGDIIKITKDVTLYAQWDKTSSKTVSAAKTNDISNTGLWILLLCVSLAGVICSLRVVQKKQQRS